MTTSVRGAQDLMAGDAVLGALLHFPAPLILVSADGSGVLTNEALHREFGPVQVCYEALSESVQRGLGPTEFSLRSVQGDSAIPVTTLCTDVADWKVILVGHASADSPRAELQRLRHAIAGLERAATTDHLTGAWNRAHFDRVIATELQLSSDTGRPLTLVLIDVDHFKKVNDTHGHAAGDEVLRQMVRTMKGCLRQSDDVFRWGGEEFAILVRNAGARSSRRVAEAVRVAMHDAPIGQVGHVTVSAGVAERLDGENTGDWFDRLDAALYRAKTNGRDRVEVDWTGHDPSVSLTPGLALTWLDRYECGEPTIDGQHRALFELANQALAAVLRQTPDAVAVLEGLVAEIRKHFSDEESILARLDYPGLAWHKRAHDQLMVSALRMLSHARAGRLKLGEVTDFLVGEVVARHMLEEDRQFACLLDRQT